MYGSALLIGNGLNRASDNIAWIDMLDELRKSYHVKETKSLYNFPLEYERIYLAAKKRAEVQSPYRLNRRVAKLLPNVSDLELHKIFLSLPVEDIMTTNYDYYLETAQNELFSRKHASSNTNERLHSVFRQINTGNKKFWHIHGECACPASICLGYQHYCSYLSRMFNFLTYPHPGICQKPYIRHFLSKGQIQQDSWLTRFFTHDIYILGLSMSLIEIDLWWLLSYRIRLLLDSPHLAITNQIHYYYVESYPDEEQLSLLLSMGVQLHPIPLICDNWTEMYHKIRADIKVRIKI